MPFSISLSANNNEHNQQWRLVIVIRHCDGKGVEPMREFGQ
jgi:hypothetical protein